MNPAVASTTPRAERPTLRLLDGCGGADPEIVCHARRRVRQAPPKLAKLRLIESQPRVLVAAADARRRESVRDELSRTLSPGTIIEEAAEMCDVLEQAPSTRMVVVAGDLDDASAEVLARLLGRTHPSLPIITLGLDAPSPAPLRSGSSACL
jgi:hypothetical protein